MTRRIVLTGIALGIAASAATQPAATDRLTLTEAVDFALKNSPVLKGSQAEIAAARAETGVARARTGPHDTYSSFGYPYNGYRFPGYYPSYGYSWGWWGVPGFGCFGNQFFGFVCNPCGSGCKPCK